MAMSVNYLNSIANYGASLIKFIGLVDENGDELPLGTYARQPAAWKESVDGAIYLESDLSFTIPAGSTVAGWRGYSDSTGGTDFGGEDVEPTEFPNKGVYILLADNTGVRTVGE